MKTAPLKLAISCIFATFTFLLTSCGGGGSNTPPTPTVSLSGQPASLVTGATTSITATTSTGVGVNWAVTCATSPCGSFSAASTPSGTATTYTAPSSAQSVTITATTSSGAAASATATISVTAPPISVTINNPPSSIAASATASLTATVTNDTQTKGVTWTVTCSNSGACGSFNPTSTASGSATVYTAPAAIPTSGTVTVTATSVTDTTKSASATITITAPGISVALNPTPPTSLIIGATSSLTAVVSNDSHSAGVTWTVTCGSSACGSFSSATTPSGTATTYTAPATVPSPNTVTVKATSVTDTTKSASATITINPALADATYVYHLSGWDNSGLAFFVGAFTVSGGVITAGEQDFRDPSGADSADQLIPSKCSISVAGNNIQVVLAVSNTAVGVSGIETIRGTVVSSSRTLISEFDTFAAATGSIDLQTGRAAPSGGYAFAVNGFDIGSQGNFPLAIGGVLNVSGSSLNVTGSIFDFNLGGGTGQPLIGTGETFTMGSVSAVDNFGRVSFNLTPSTTSQVPQFILTGYIVGTNQIQLVESQSDTLSDDLGGMALGQGSNTGQFNQSSITGKTYVFGTQGMDIENVVTIGGTFSFNSLASISGNFALNDGTAFGAFTYSGASASVDATGRVSLVGLSIPSLSTTPFNFQLYLDGNGNAMVIGVDALEVTAGPAYLQSATGDFEGTYGLVGDGFLNLSGVPFFGAVGPVTVASDALSGTTDYNYQGLATPISAQPLTGTETSASGTLALTGIDGSSFTTSRTYSYFPIDSKRVLAIETDGAQIGLLTLEGASH